MSTQVGKAMRLKRVIDPAGVSIICALDHGMTSPTFLEPLAGIADRTAEAVAGGANVIMMSKGMIRVAERAFSPTTSLALLLSASANPDGDRPRIVQIAEVEEALVLGADAVVLFTALGGETEPEMIEILAGVGRECAQLGMPFIAEAEFPTTYATVEELKQQAYGVGFDVMTGQFVDMFKAGIVDPTKVVRSALQNAASVAGLVLTTEAMVVEKPEEEKETTPTPPSV